MLWGEFSRSAPTFRCARQDEPAASAVEQWLGATRTEDYKVVKILNKNRRLDHARGGDRLRRRHGDQHGEKAWELAGLTSNPGGNLALWLTLNAAATATGKILARLPYDKGA
jgi:hypothetical protein